MFLDRFQLIEYFPMLHYAIFVTVILNLPFQPSSPESLQRPSSVGPYTLTFQQASQRLVLVILGTTTLEFHGSDFAPVPKTIHNLDQFSSAFKHSKIIEGNVI